jgi:O-6-methylguanine DNA methyltransferase
MTSSFKKSFQAKEVVDEFYNTSGGTLHVKLFEGKIFQAIFSDNGVICRDLPDNICLDNLLFIGTEFQKKVWKELLNIKRGETKTYSDVAMAIGSPKSCRAVANAIASNNIAYFVPCHRVVRKNGDVGGFRWGVDKKVTLLNSEKL